MHDPVSTGIALEGDPVQAQAAGCACCAGRGVSTVPLGRRTLGAGDAGSPISSGGTFGVVDVEWHGSLIAMT
jgi:hypothetical protein